jgi:hypothetical protein
MNTLERKYLKKSCTLLKGMLPLSVSLMMKWYENHPEQYNIEEIGSYLYCLFSFPLLMENGGIIRSQKELDHGRMEQMILLVYEDDVIIADTAAIHLSMHDCLFWEPAVEYICTESDWMYLAHYTLCSYSFPKIPYPAPFDTNKELIKGEALLYSNAYVTTKWRRQGIFANMLQSMRDHALRNVTEHTELYSVIALDPDIACYGTDAVEEPYIYSFEKDEPLRMRNCTIMSHVGFVPVKLEELEPEEHGDGAKLWFALRHEHDLIVETNGKLS